MKKEPSGIEVIRFLSTGRLSLWKIQHVEEDAMLILETIPFFNPQLSYLSLIVIVALACVSRGLKSR